MVARSSPTIESIYQGSNTIICYLAPPITTVFIWGVFWRRASSRGALATLTIGSFLGLVVFLLDWYKGAIDRDWNVVQFMMAAFYLFVICSAVLVVTSLIWPHKHTPQSEQLVWKHPLEALSSPGWKGVLNYKLLAGVLFVVMVTAVHRFRVGVSANRPEEASMERGLSVCHACAGVGPEWCRT